MRGLRRPIASGGLRLQAFGVTEPERILIAPSAWAMAASSSTARPPGRGDRRVFGRPIGQNQGVAFPIATAYAHIGAAALMVGHAAELFDTGSPCGAEANMAKLLAADASWEAANMAVQTFGGYGVDAESHIERTFRETRLYQVAPISTNLILSYLAEHVLDLPRSFWLSASSTRPAVMASIRGRIGR